MADDRTTNSQPSRTARFVQHCLDNYRTEPYRTVIAGHEFLVYPNVFSPSATPSTPCMVEGMSVPPGGHVLDMGCGTGVLGILALHRGAATARLADIHEDAVNNARANVELHGLASRCQVVVSDMFEALDGDRFDAIYLNFPCLYAEAPLETEALGAWSQLEQAYYDVGYQQLARLLADARHHLRDGGSIQLLFVEDHPAADRALLDERLRAAGLTRRTIHRVPNPSQGTCEVIYELRPQPPTPA